MADTALQAPPIEPAARSSGPNLDKGFNPLSLIIFAGIMVAGLLYVVYSVYSDIDETGAKITAFLPFAMLFIALLIALGFEFVNGFHDTANAVATVIYTHSLPAEMAVVWSGAFNFLGVLTSTGAVAFGIVSLLPVELILQVGSSAGFAMVFALLIAAIVWNLGTWWLGLPASSSHTLIGSIIGVGVANALSRGMDGTSGVDWSKATEIGYALLLSPLVGFVFSALLLLALKFLVRNPTLYEAPKGNQPPPWWIRGILILTCTGVSFAHGSNDGQKGMGLIMLILIGTVPTAYALNHTPAPNHVESFPGSICRSSSRYRKASRWVQRAGRSPARRHGLCLTAQDQRRHLRVARRAGEGDLDQGRAVRLNCEDPAHIRRQRPQRHVPRVRGVALSDEGQGELTYQAGSGHPQLHVLARFDDFDNRWPRPATSANAPSHPRLLAHLRSIRSRTQSPSLRSRLGANHRAH